MKRILLISGLWLGMIATGSPTLAVEFLPPRYRLKASHIEGKAEHYKWQRVFSFQDSAGSDLIAELITNKIDTPGDPQSRIFVYDDQIRIIAQINRRYPISRIFARQVEEGGNPELVLVNDGDSESTVEVCRFDDGYTIGMFALSAKDFPDKRRNLWDMSVQVGPLVTGVLKDRPALLLYCKNGYGLAPRGVLLIDPVKGKEIWHYWIPNGPTTMDVMDVDGDSLPEIVVGGNAPANGAKVNTMVDTRSYLTVLNTQGHLLWMKEFPGPFSSIFALPLHFDSGSPPVFLVLFQASHPDAGPSRLMRMNALNGDIISSVNLSNTPTGFERWGRSVYGTETFILSILDRGVQVYDETLRLLADSPSMDDIVLVADINGDGKSEIIGKKAGAETVLLDHSLSVMAAASVPWAGRAIRQQNPESRFAYVWGETADGITRFSIIGNPGYLIRILTWVGMLAGTVTIIVLIQALYLTRVRVVRFKAQSERERYQAWSAMASYMAHKTKTPLANIAMSSQNLKEELGLRYGDIPEDLRHYFQTFNEDVKRAYKSLQSIIKFAREVPPTLEPTDLAFCLRKTVEHSPHPHGVSVDLDLSSDIPMVNVDWERIETAVENFISNSYKAMKNGGNLAIRLRVERKLQDKDDKPGWVVLEISDTGSGIPTNDLPHVFEPGFTTTEDGSGIGLVIARKNIEDHGGKISISSTVGKGTTVTVRLPALPNHTNNG